MILLSEDAYKELVSRECADLFKNKILVQAPKLTEDDIVKKMKGYKINHEDKKVRICKVDYRKSPEVYHTIVDIAVCYEVNDQVIWNR